ncbi:MAG TPA: hydroxymethylglutaryl-CoA lyase [Thermoflexales bacterium]|nr:hydroxymethylglutaryl-CoA lyase [Thermoflexales bacterium]HQZ52131.1 hydroxymethylglutaryl-CoA lyase [Thermoflexales bacterium]
MHFPARVTLIEVGPRDGWQAESILISTPDKIALIDGLSASGLRAIQVTSFVSPARVPQMADAEAVCAGIARRPGVEYSGLALNLRGVERAAGARLDKVDISSSASDTHSRRNTGMGLEDAAREVHAMAARARALGLRVRAGVQCAFGCAYEGGVDPQRVLNLLRGLVACEVEEVLLADSTGMANPAQISRMLEAALPILGEIPLVLHLHDTRGMGLANVMAALEHGVSRFDTAFGGLGGCPFIPGASGNIATEDTLHMLAEMQIATGVRLAAVAAVSARMALLLGRALPGKRNHLALQPEAP